MAEVEGAAASHNSRAGVILEDPRCDANGLPLLVLAVSWAAFVVMAALGLVLADGIVEEAEESRLFIFAGPLALLLATPTAILTRHALLRWAKDPRALDAALVVCHAAYWVGCLWTLRAASWRLGTAAPGLALIIAALAGFVLAQVAAVPLARRWGAAANPSGPQRLAYPALPILAILAALPFLSYLQGITASFLSYLQGATASLSAAAFVVGIAAAARYRRPFVGRALRPRAADGLVALLVVAFTVDPFFHFNPHHHNFFLGPVNDLLAGKVILVDVFSQYGVLTIAALAVLLGVGPLPLSYQGLSLVVSLLMVAQYGAIYLLLRATLRSQALSALGLLTVSAVNFSGQLGYAQEFPSTGPLRFGLFYLLLLIVLVRYRSPRHWAVCLSAEAALVGVAAIWSLETFSYTLLAYLAVVAYEELSAPAETVPVTRRLAGRLLALAGATGAAHGLLAVLVHAQSGSWPQWQGYLAYLGLYMGGEFGALPIEPWTPWPLPLAVYALSLLALLHEWLRSRTGRTSWNQIVALAMSVFGLAQYSYFIGRSHPNNLHHVAIPAIFLLFWWLSKLSSPATGVVPSFRRSALLVGHVTVALLLLLEAPSAWEKLDSTIIGAGMAAPQSFARLADLSARDLQGAEAVFLLKTYASTGQRVPIFIDPDRTTEALMLTRKANVFPISHPDQERLLPQARERVLAFPHGLKPGAILFVAVDLDDLNDLQHAVVDRLCGEFAFDEIERTSTGVAAVRLNSLSPGQTACDWGGRSP